MADLFGRYCYIDTPWIAGKKTRYRIIGSGVRSNAWCEIPVTGRTELIHHDNMEEVVFVVLDTLVSDDSIIRRFALKDVDLPPADVRPVVRGKWIKVGGYFTPGGDPVWECSECGKGRHVYGVEHGTYGADISDGQWVACPNCDAWMKGGESDG